VLVPIGEGVQLVGVPGEYYMLLALLFQLINLHFVFQFF
jgi:hypothetical protein